MNSSFPSRRTWVGILLTTWLCILAGCAPARPPAAETTEQTSEPPQNSHADSSEEISLPTTEPLALIYTDYITVQTRQDGIAYTYTYCFDEHACVFNAIATLQFSKEADARNNYLRLAADGYPNLKLNGTQLSFAFPRRECPYYGISYRALWCMLDDTVYEITDFHAPEPEASSEASANS